MSLDPHALKIYVDGSALDNPGGAGGFAAWVEFPIDWHRPNELLFQRGFQETTNQRMELLACIRAFEHIAATRFDSTVQRIQIVTDSKYVHDHFFLADRWRKNGWRNLDGKPIENRDLWKRLLSVRSKVRVRTEVEWMLGKKSQILRTVDKSAKAASAEPWHIDRGFKSGKIGRSITKTKKSASMFQASGQEATIRIYRTTLLGRADHKIYFNVFSEASGQFDDKAYGYCSPEVAVDLHRHHIYRVRFNANPKYPIIERIVDELHRASIDSVHVANLNPT
jgi:ribonuclease HI